MGDRTGPEIVGQRGWVRRTRNASTLHQQPLLISLFARISVSGGGGGGVSGGRVDGSYYEPGEVRREPLPYWDDPGYRDRAGSGSSRGHEFSGGKDPGGFRDAYTQGRGGGRPLGRSFDGSGFGPVVPTLTLQEERTATTAKGLPMDWRKSSEGLS